MILLDKRKFSIQELAAFLTPGMLGLQQVDGKAYNLLFRPEKAADPRIKLLLEQSWFELRHTEGVLWAAATLEAYNELYESEVPYIATGRVAQWLADVTDEDRLYVKDRLPLKDSPLFDYQQEAVEFLTYHSRAMLSLSPGLGKSLVSAYAAGLLGFDNILLVCPASLLYYWKSELEKWQDKLPRQPFPAVIHRDTNNLGGVTLLDSSDQYWGITNPETLARHLDKFLVNHNWDLLIVDESIMYKHRDSVRSKQLKTMAQAVENCWLLTGAPATRYLDDFWHQFHILNPRGYSSYWRFARKYCVVDENQWGSAVVANKKGAEKAIQKNFADIYFSRNQDDVLDIPDWIFEDIDIPMLPKQDAVYKRLRKELLIEIGGLGDDEEIKVTNHLALMIRSIQVASNPLLVGAVDASGKWDALPELLTIYPGPYIIWCNFIKTGELLREHFSAIGYKLALANGATKMEDRNSMVTAFQNGELDAIIMNSDVGKFGWTLTKARTAFFVERTYSDSYFQCLHRNRRIGTTQSPIIVNMRSVTHEGGRSIDHVIHDVLDYRTGMIKRVTARMLRESL